MTEAEAVLGRVIRALETPDSGDCVDPEVVLPVLRVYHAALVDLLTHGPLRCDEAIAREKEQTDQFPMQPEDVSVLRAELLQLLRSAVRWGQIEQPSSRISTRGAVLFAVRLVDGRAVISAQGDTYALVILQTVLLLQEVGLANVHKCSAPDCPRLFVKVYRREFCSVQCQKRINTRKQRETAQGQRARLARRRRRARRTKGA